METISCPACGQDCYNNGVKSFCRRCSIEIHELNGKPPAILLTRSDPKHGDSFPISKTHYWLDAIATITNKYSGKSAAPTSKDQPCRQCDKPCTITDKKCWWCECPYPCKD